MKTIEEITMLTEAQEYDRIIKELQEAKESGQPLNEGVFKAVIGGLAGMAIGPAITKAICKVLGIDVNGQFGKLVTSRLVTTAIGYELGLNK